MIHFFGDIARKVYAVEAPGNLYQQDTEKLNWLFGNEPKLELASLDAFFVGPRAAMVTPWSTNATEITQNMGISGIIRIEEFKAVNEDFEDFDPMLFQKYSRLDQDLYDIHITPQPIIEVDDIAAYNEQEGLALSPEEITYLEDLANRLGRKLTDSEVFGFSQVNSEHCRHKIFNGTFVIDGEEKPVSLFKLIKKTSEKNPNHIVSAYKDNVAFITGPEAVQFAPKSADKPDYYEEKPFESVISLKAETHNFPTTVEPFNGAATGSGGEIRDRLAGGKGSLPLAGTAVYITSYSRLADDRHWEKGMPERKWLYQTPMDILIKASNGASDFGNKFGQPLISGSLLTFEHEEHGRRLGYDKVIMLAGGIGYGKASQALKDTPEKGDKIVILGGDNYRIGMGGAAVSSADTGAFSTAIELNAVQRSNPEMQKRAANAIRGLVELDHNPIVSIHDHGAGGHLNCLSELVEETGGYIDMDQLPIGDPTLSSKEIIGNESQERMGLVMGTADMELLKRVAARERSPMYEVGEVTGDHRFTFESAKRGEKPMDLELSDMFGSSPQTIMNDKSVARTYEDPAYQVADFKTYLTQVLQLEAVACKDWLTNKVDRCVGGRVATQQCAGPLQLPLNNCGVMALDFKGKAGIATSIGHSPVSGLIDPVAGSRNSITEALTNIVWAPLADRLKAVSLSANWMWPCKNPGEDARLYEAVQAVSEFSIELGINVPTGKDSLSMKQKYPDGEVIAPGTVIISAAGQCEDLTKTVEPVLQKNGGAIYYLNWSQDNFKLGGSSFNQVRNKVGSEAPSVKDAAYVKTAFNTIQELIARNLILAGHDVASGGLITTLLEMCFADLDLGAKLDLSALGEKDSVKLLFAENTGIVFQAKDDSVEQLLKEAGLSYFRIGSIMEVSRMDITNYDDTFSLDIPELREYWYRTSYLLDTKQTANGLAKDRFENYSNQPLDYVFPVNFNGKLNSWENNPKPKAAILREKGSNSEREMAHALYLAGFEVKDVHMTDLITGRETLEDIQFIGAVGGFSNSDVLGSAKGWAGAFKYNEKARTALRNFFDREDTLSVGICNGCQLFMELDLINPNHPEHGRMTFNDSHKHESSFTSVTIQPNNSVMLSSLAGTTLGVWISHGEGKFSLPLSEENYDIVGKYGYEAYPANPNGSDYNTAMLCDPSGRHMVTMPHIERSIFPWNWAHYPKDRNDQISPWIEAFINARNWILNHGRS
ncbi:phosphoribosylformylglycinamidine synthase [Lentiprolixibacter aurantiacus]|uniref:Phosphoribosylformylglycinamidine synthase n=1 Tax=Lentiprolixibacter aurantiacus TaxID=2993939 RepID=A0AAE3MM00_9FLAO|nr:phosphoribosylformylglycinamidine synthase [Lentiprolixibacter aurantiacus]MCX2720245.1 phosphoribosylformylglycinamidine synthase [Lentiprolixibacter aurantiacus]